MKTVRESSYTVIKDGKAAPYRSVSFPAIEVVTVTGFVLSESKDGKSILFSGGPKRRDGSWIPKAQVQVEELQGGKGKVKIELPYWLAEQHGLKGEDE